jgi:hypothetical protein
MAEETRRESRSTAHASIPRQRRLSNGASPRAVVSPTRSTFSSWRWHNSARGGAIKPLNASTAPSVGCECGKTYPLKSRASSLRFAPRPKPCWPAPPESCPRIFSPHHTEWSYTASLGRLALGARSPRPPSCLSGTSRLDLEILCDPGAYPKKALCRPTGRERLIHSHIVRILEVAPPLQLANRGVVCHFVYGEP